MTPLNNKKMKPMGIESGDYVCFIGGNNDDEILCGRVTENAKQVRGNVRESYESLFASLMQRFRNSPRIRVKCAGEFGCIGKQGYFPNEVLVDESKAVIIHSKRILEGFEVCKDGKQGQLQKYNFSTKMAHVRIYGTDLIIPFVKVADLTPPPAYKVRAGQTVLLDDWIGRVKMINRHFTINMSDNTVTNWELEENVPVVYTRGDIHWNPYEAFFEGQWIQVPIAEGDHGIKVRRLYTDGSGFLLRCSKVPQECILQPPNGILSGIVQSICIMAIKIDWIKRIPDSNMAQPKEVFFKAESQDAWNKLKVLDHLSGDYVSVGSNRFYKITKSDRILKHSDASQDLLRAWFPQKFSEDDKKSSATIVEPLKEGTEYRVEVFFLYSGIEVAWEDDSVSHLPIPELHESIYECPVQMAEFKVGCIVENRLPWVLPLSMLGVVRRVKPNDFILSVKWFRYDSDSQVCCMGTEDVSCFDVGRLDQEPRPSCNFILTGGIGPNEVRWSYPFEKLCVLRKNELVKTFKAAVILNYYHADVNGRITAYCGNEVLSLSPFELVHSEDIFNVKNNNKKNQSQTMPVIQTESMEIIEKPSNPVIDSESVEYSSTSSSFLQCGKTSFVILQQAPTNHFFAKIPLNQSDVPALEENSKMFEIEINHQNKFSDIWVSTYKDRPDLFSVLIAGKHGTPYFGGLFVFEVYIMKEFPRKAPLVMYVGPLSLPNPVLGHFDSSKRITSLLDLHDSFHSDWRLKWDPESFTLKNLLTILHDSVHLPNSKLHDGLPEKSVQAMFNGFCIVEILSCAFKLLQDPSSLEPWKSYVENDYPVVVLSLLDSVRKWTSPEEKAPFDLLPLPKALKVAIEHRIHFLSNLDVLQDAQSKKLA